MTAATRSATCARSCLELRRRWSPCLYDVVKKASGNHRVLVATAAEQRGHLERVQDERRRIDVPQLAMVALGCPVERVRRDRLVSDERRLHRGRHHRRRLLALALRARPAPRIRHSRSARRPRARLRRRGIRCRAATADRREPPLAAHAAPHPRRLRCDAAEPRLRHAHHVRTVREPVLRLERERHRSRRRDGGTQGRVAAQPWTPDEARLVSATIAPASARSAASR